MGIAVDTLAAYAAAAGIPVPTVRQARYGLMAAAVGAAALVWHRFLRPIPVGTPTVKNKVLGVSPRLEPSPKQRVHGVSRIEVKDVFGD